MRRSQSCLGTGIGITSLWRGGRAMNLSRRKFVRLAAGAAAFPALPRSAAALDYPTRPVRLLVGYAPGGVADIIGRITGEMLTERLNQQFIVENHSGAGSKLATEEVVRAQPDGYTLLGATASNAWNAAIYQNLNFDFIRDVAPVASTVRSYNVMVVNPSLPVKNVAEFIAYAKANPGKINMGSAGPGSSPHLYGEAFQGDGGGRSGHGALSRRRPCNTRPHRRTDSGHVRLSCDLDRADQVREGAGIGGDQRRAHAAVA